MKKNFFIAGSLILAIALFAFTTIDRKQTKGTDPEYYYWYSVTHDGSGDMIQFQSPDYLTLAEAELAEFNCGGDDRVCKAGYTSPLSFNGTDPILDVPTPVVDFSEEIPLR
jgi:hypothetical protein